MIIFTQGDDDIDVNLIAQDGNGKAVNITGASFSTQILGPSGVIVTIPDGQHTITDAENGLFSVNLTAANTQACAPGDNKEIVTQIVQSGSTVYYHGRSMLKVLPNTPVQ